MKTIFKQLTREKGCQPWKAQVPLLSQIPLWIVMLLGCPVLGPIRGSSLQHFDALHQQIPCR